MLRGQSGHKNFGDSESFVSAAHGSLEAQWIQQPQRFHASESASPPQRRESGGSANHAALTQWKSINKLSSTLLSSSGVKAYSIGWNGCVLVVFVPNSSKKEDSHDRKEGLSVCLTQGTRPWK